MKIKKIFTASFLLLVLASFSKAWAGTCTVDATQTNQFIHCIGASSAWSAIGSQGQALFADDNVNGHIGLSSLRARIDPTNNFSSEVNSLVTAHSVNPNVLLWATEWSPPAQYKANDNVDGGASNDTFLGASSGSPNSADTGLASYQVSFIQYCQSHGINLYALSIQNEPNFNPTYEACLWTAGQFDVYAQAFHNAIQNAGLSTKIMLPEPDNTDGMNLAATAMDDATVAPMIGIIGTHLYGTPNPAPLASFGFTHVTNQEWWETEMSGNTTDIPGALQEAGWIQSSLVNSGMNAFHYWWLTDLISNNTLTIKAYVLGNYSKFIRPGYYRMGATASPTSGVLVSAFKNTNTSSPQTIVFVAINNNSSTTSQTFSLNGVNVTSVIPWVTDGSNNLVQKSAVPVSGNSFTYSLTGSSVTSFVAVNNGGSVATSTSTPLPATPTRTATAVPPTPTATFTNTPAPIIASTWRVNAGGPAYTDSLGNAWSADTQFTAGSTIAEGGTIAGTNDSTLYDTQRYGSNFSYVFHVPTGSYQATLLFAETYSGDEAVGDRVFDVAVNGVTVLTNLDVFAQVGANKALNEVINNISPSAGAVTIQFLGTSSTDTSAMVEALQLIPQPALATPTRTSTASPTATATASATATPVPPTLTSTATATKTNTPVPPTLTATLTPTASPTDTSVPPTTTDTPIGTLTMVPATATNTPVPPTFTSTPVPPTATLTVTSTASATKTWTATAVPPTATATPTKTNTPVPPTSTATLPPTSTPTLVPTNTPTGTGSLTVYLLSGVTANTTNSPHPQIEVKNTGTAPLNLNNVEVRYWFNCDCTGQSIQTWVDWAGWMPAGSTVTADVLTSVVATTLGGQTDYVSYKFAGNLTLQPGQSVQIQSRFNKSDWSNMLQNNDWSYTASTSFTLSTKITGYLNGSLIWGQEPVVTAPAAQTANVVAFPNPSTGNGVNLSVNVTGSASSIGAKAVSTSPGIDPSGVLTFRAYSLDGQLVWVKTVEETSFESSGHSLYWNERNLENQSLSSGLYIVTVTVKSGVQSSTSTVKVAIVK